MLLHKDNVFYNTDYISKDIAKSLEAQGYKEYKPKKESKVQENK